MPINSVVVENVSLLPRTSAKISANLLVLQSYPSVAQNFTSERAVQVENLTRVQSWRGSLLVLGTGPNALNADIFIGQDSYGWPVESFEPPTFIQPQKFNAVIRNSFPTYNVANDRRVKQSIQFYEPETFAKQWTASQVVINRFTPYVPGTDVRRAIQAKYFQDPESFPKAAPFNILLTNGTGQSHAVPNVVGLLQAQAILVLDTASYANIRVYTVNSVLVPPGVVDSQNPVGGTIYPNSGLISLYVSIGPFVPGAPSSLGNKVTTRNFSLQEMVEREWGSSYSAPDHRIYEFSNGRGFDSTDMGDTGIYHKGTSTQ